MTGLRIVPSVATAQQKIDLHSAIEAWTGTCIHEPIPPAIYDAAFKRAPALTDEQIDGLCRKMWGDADYWDQRFDSEQQEWSTTRYRNDDRTRMRAFILAIHGA